MSCLCWHRRKRTNEPSVPHVRKGSDEYHRVKCKRAMHWKRWVLLKRVLFKWCIILDVIRGIRRSGSEATWRMTKGCRVRNGSPHDLLLLCRLMLVASGFLGMQRFGLLGELQLRLSSIAVEQMLVGIETRGEVGHWKACKVSALLPPAVQPACVRS